MGPGNWVAVLKLVSKNRWLATLPTLWFLLAYIGTTVIAALIYTAPGGTDMMAVIGVDLPPAVAADIGTPIYFALLILPLFVVPLTAAGTIFALQRAPVSVFDRVPTLRISRWSLAILMAVSFGYGLYRLNQLGALNIEVLSCGAVLEKLARRMNLLSNLGYPYFALAYGANMMLPLLAYLAYEKQGRHKTDLVIFAVALVGMVFFVLMTYSKAPLLVFLIMMASTVFIARAPLRHLVVVAAICGTVFLGLAAVVNSSKRCDPQVALVAALTDTTVLTDASPSPILVDYHPETATTYLTKLLVFGIVQRMGASFPFYVHMYKDPANRCGLQGIIRGSIGLPPLKCDLSIEVSAKMWPQLTVAGQQPAPATVSAYGEIGFLWAIAVMVLSGLALGLLGAMSVVIRGPLAVAFCAAGCGFGYYLTQVPFFGSFTYPHGLIPFLAPIGLLAAASVLNPRKEI